jgi:hypothetical protein
VTRGRVVAVEGPSAAGKTTAVAAVAERLGAVVVPEAFRRLAPAPSLEFATEEQLLDLERSLLDEDARRFADARRAAGSGATVLADTGFLGPLTYTAGLVELRTAGRRTLAALVDRARQLAAQGAWGLAEGYVYLATSPHLQFARARADPVGHPTRLAARHVAVGGIERRFYRERFAPLLGPRFEEISGDGAHDAVAIRLRTAVQRVASPRVRAPPTEAVLALFEPPASVPNPARGNR